MLLADWRCPVHGVFEEYASRDADDVPCPECGTSSPWSPSPVRGKVKIAEVHTGKYEPPPAPGFLNTRELGEGMDEQEWRDKRNAFHEERRKKELKDLLA